MDDLPSSRKDKTKGVSAHSFIQQKLLSSTIMEFTVWGEADNNEIITQMNVESQRSGKDAIRAHLEIMI